jgi:2Fe-2S ferredoxin
MLVSRFRRALVNVKFVGDGISRIVQGACGESLLHVAEKHEIRIPNACEGSGACATCQLYITKGHNFLAQITPEEEDTLDFAVDVRQNSRLACRAIITASEGEIEAVIPKQSRNII